MDITDIHTMSTAEGAVRFVRGNAVSKLGDVREVYKDSAQRRLAILNYATILYDLILAGVAETEVLDTATGERVNAFHPTPAAHEFWTTHQDLSPDEIWNKWAERARSWER